MRCFIDIDVPQEVKRQLADLQNNLRKDLSGKYEKPEQFHLTLKFLGDVEDKKINSLSESLRGVTSQTLEIMISRIGQFNNRIVWVDAKGAEELKKQIDGVLPEFKDDFKEFNPHITLVRMGHTTRLDETIKKYSVNSSFQVNSFNLKKSTLTPKGATHEIIETFYLK